MNDEIRVEEKVTLHKAVMIIGLGGWGNAGEVSTFTVKYLAEKLGAKKFGEIPPEMFHDYFIQRPMVSVEDGVMESYTPPKNDLFYWKNKEDGPDVLLLLGTEPHHNWRRYAEAILGLAKETGVQRIYTIGGFLADISHQGEIPITASTNNRKLVAELKNAEVELTNYRGPTSVYSEILWKARDAKVDAVSLWCAVPMYIVGLFPRAAYCMLKKIAQMTGIELDLKDIEEKAEAFKERLERETVSLPQLRNLIEASTRRRQEPTYIL
jgi:proteasome assembly chaperone (PAC2) family protein